MLEDSYEPAHPYDPFLYTVPGAASEGGAKQTTLLSLAAEQCGVPLSDLRALNAELDGVRATQPLAAGTRVRLPLLLPDQSRGPDLCGSYFTVKKEEARLQQCDAHLDTLVRALETDSGTPLPPLPSRHVLSQTEQVRSVIDAEVDRQLPHVTKELESVGRSARQLPYLVEIEAVQRCEVEAKERFSEQAVPLFSYTQDNAAKLSSLVSGASLLTANEITEPELQPTKDLADDFCVVHSHRWEFAVCKASSLVVREEWAVLSCQPLTVLMDAMRASCVAGNIDGYTEVFSRNSFLYMAGTFYIDDRHRGAEDFEDLTAGLRGLFQQTEKYAGGTGPDGLVIEAGPGAFSRCSVESAAHTTWGDVRVKVGELCVLRHLNGCTHYFYLLGPRALSQDDPHARLLRSQYPHRTAKKKDVALRCQLCKQFPSTIALYDDPLSSCSPAVYCEICYELLHGDDTEADSRSYVKVRPEKVGDYFKQVH